MADLHTTGMLVSSAFLARYQGEIARVERETGARLEPIPLPDDPELRLEPVHLERVELAFFSPDLFPDGSPSFFSALYKAPRLRWLQVFNAGVDHPIFAGLTERGVRLTNAAGTSAEPIAQTLIAALLMLSRGFPHWLDAQRRRSWERLPADRTPADLRGQRLVVLGLGGIGVHIARLAQALGLYVTGVRRTPAGSEDFVDRWLPPERLREALPESDWLAIACPLTAATRGMVDKAALQALKPGARVLNVARGEVLDESALIEALRSGHLGGAYLDVFEVEPLPPGSPLWDLPNVLLTPHDSSRSRGNPQRQVEIFFRNLRHWVRGEPLENEVGSP